MSYQLTGTLDSVMLDLAGGTVSTLRINEKNLIQKAFAEFEGKKISIEIKQYREKRSLDANAYCWVLLRKLAEKIGSTDIEVYREIIRRKGRHQIVPIRNDAVSTFRSDWERHGKGWVTDTLGVSKLEGYENIVIYTGSSEYDAKEMSVFIDEIVQECKAQDIETKTPRELAVMLEEWHG